MNLLLLIITILLDATGDGLMLKHKMWGHAVQSLYVLTWLTILWYNDRRKYNWQLRDFLYLIIGYALIRHGIFDYTWNLTAGQDIFFHGSTSLYDKYIAGSLVGIWPARLFSLLSGVLILKSFFHYKLKY